MPESFEFYDFLIYIYGTAAALVFPKLFFPNASPAMGVLLSFATFGVGFFARPLGGVVFGHFRDRVGRKRMLVYALLGMGVSTVLIGLLPTYAQVDVAAPILLTLLRLVQGFAVGGEWGGATLMAVERAYAAAKTSDLIVAYLIGVSLISAVSVCYLPCGWRRT